MVAYNFKERFAWLVEDGIKRQTVRAVRSRPTRAGDALQLYTGMRKPGARLLRVEKCVSVKQVEISDGQICVNGDSLLPEAELMFAWRDGFQFIEDFMGFFEQEYGDAFSGEVIRWSVPTVDQAVYAGLRMDPHFKWDRQPDGGWKPGHFTAQMLEAGMSLWQGQSGRVVGIRQWNGWDEWIEVVKVTPAFVFDGIPLGWRESR